MITIITGDRGIGKTTFLLKKSNIQTNEINTVYGILTPPIFDNRGIKIGFSALDLSNNKRWELARTDIKLQGSYYGPFNFSSKGFERANNIIIDALKQGISPIFLDEVGPLELSKKSGFYPSLSHIEKMKDSQDLFIVIRPELIPEYVKRVIPTEKYRIITVNKENRDQLELF